MRSPGCRRKGVRSRLAQVDVCCLRNKRRAAYLRLHKKGQAAQHMDQYFGLLADDSGTQETCTVELGAQAVSARAVRFETKTMTEAMQCKNFSGACYHCDMPGHSQNQCPIRRCTQCHQYGHSARWCPQSAATTTRGEDATPLWMKS